MGILSVFASSHIDAGNPQMHWTDDVSLLFDPLRELSRHSDDRTLRSVMTEGVPELSANHYDNWNGGTTYYTLAISVPIHVYAAIENKVEDVESQIVKKVERIHRDETHDFVDKVVVKPATTAAVRIIPSWESRFWAASHFRLFVSHLSVNKDAANNLKRALAPLGISAFVAHEDIKPTKEWQDEIEKALFSMDALAAILAPSFGSSAWTDHEVGIALGRGVLVLPIRYGIDPYGLLGKYQALQGKGRTLGEVSESVFRAILENERTSTRLVSCLVEQFLVAGSSEAAATKLKLLDRTEEISTEHLHKIRDKAANSGELAKDAELLEQINQLLTRHGVEPVMSTGDSGDHLDDEIPF